MIRTHLSMNECIGYADSIFCIVKNNFHLFYWKCKISMNINYDRKVL